MEKDKFAEINLKIAEIKKRILLAEGQKTANSSEWQKQNRINGETIGTLKKEIKELTIRCGRLKNPLQWPFHIKDPISETSDKKPASKVNSAKFLVGNITYPVGAKSIEDAIFLTDLKVIEIRKQLDLMRHRYKCRKEYYRKMIEQYHELLSNKEAQSQNMGEKPPETLEEDANRKLVCQLENEIHRTNVQWKEAEHIRKKYRSIEASLMNDAEKFERSLKELEQSLNEQQTEINRLQQVHDEAIEMRDNAKLILQRQEQQSHISQKTRDRQVFEFRKQVDFRKMELERIGRKLFIEGKTLVHQDSLGSCAGDQLTSKTEHDEDPNTQLESVTTEMENVFKTFMEVSGATSPQEVLQRFSSQKESSTRLNYLRTAAESEKAHLETQREELTKELEASKFSNIKENEVSQEVIERIKNSITDLNNEKKRNFESGENTLSILTFIKERLCEMIYRLQEIDESQIHLEEKQKIIAIEDLPHYLETEADDKDFIEILKSKLKRTQKLSKLQDKSNEKLHENQSFDNMEQELLLQLEIPKSPSIHESERPQPMPTCYYNLLAGRAQRAAGTSSSSPDQAPPAPIATDDENEVPSRNFLKRQSVLIVDSKSRRKPFRATPGGIMGRRK